MKPSKYNSQLLALSLVALTATGAAAANGQPDGMRLTQTIPLQKVQGPIGPLWLDEASGMLFAAAPENNSVEVIDTKKGAPLRSLAGITMPQGVLYVAAGHRLYVTSGNGVEIFDPTSGTRSTRIEVGDGAGELGYDAAARQLYVGISGGLAVVNPATGRKVAEVKLHGDPAAFRLETSGSRIFVNVPGKSEIAVVDRKKEEVSSTIPVTWAQNNVSMALDEKNKRLLVTTLKPSKMLVLDTGSLQWITEVAPNDALGAMGDVLYNATSRQVFALCGTARVPGFVGMVVSMAQESPDHYKITGQTVTGADARSGAYSQASRKLFVGVKATKDQAAEIRVFDAK